MMDREGFERWLERMTRRHAAQKRWEYYQAEMHEFTAPPVAADVEAFITDLQRSWGKR